MRIAGSYLAGGERGSGVRWWELGAALDECGSGEGNADHILAGAHAGFRSQRNWLREHAPALRVA